MKRYFAIFLIFALLLAACGKTEAPATEPATEATAAQETEAPETIPAETEPHTITTNDKGETVLIHVPNSMFDNDETQDMDFEAFAAENGLLSATPTENGTVQLEMTKVRHLEILDALCSQTEETFALLVEGEDTPYVKEITHNEDFTQVTIRVIKADYENAFDFTPFTVAMSSTVYQMFLDMESHVEMEILDADTGDLIRAISYPQDFQ